MALLSALRGGRCSFASVPIGVEPVPWTLNRVQGDGFGALVALVLAAMEQGVMFD